MRVSEPYGYADEPTGTSTASSAYDDLGQFRLWLHGKWKDLPGPLKIREVAPWCEMTTIALNQKTLRRLPVRPNRHECPRVRGKHGLAQ